MQWRVTSGEWIAVAGAAHAKCRSLAHAIRSGRRSFTGSSHFPRRMAHRARAKQTAGPSLALFARDDDPSPDRRFSGCRILRALCEGCACRCFFLTVSSRWRHVSPRRGICTCLSAVCAKANHASGVKTPESPRLYGGDKSPPFQQRGCRRLSVNVAQVFRPEAFHVNAVVLPPPPCVGFKSLGSKEPSHINATTCRPEGTALHANRLAASIQSTTRRRVVVLKSAQSDD